MPPVPRQFDVVLERDEEGYYVASVPQIPSCHTQAWSPDEVTQRIREAIELCLEVEGGPEDSLHAHSGETDRPRPVAELKKAL